MKNHAPNRSHLPRAREPLAQFFAPITCGLLLALLLPELRAADAPAVANFHKSIQPLLASYCSDCHLDGMKKGGIAFDEYASVADLVAQRELWFKVLKNVRAELMPPAKKKERPSPEERQRLEAWIKLDAFGIDPQNPDPGRVTVRRLNRVEYRNTIRDLMGVNFDAENEFPPDDTGYGFDNIGDVLTVSPMLLEKYLAAAKVVVTEAVPTYSKMMPERTINGSHFRPGGVEGSGSARKKDSLFLSYYDSTAVSNSFKAEHPGQYKLSVSFSANEKHVENRSDYNRSRLTFKVDGKELLQKEYGRENNKTFTYAFDQELTAGTHELTFEVQPLTTNEHVRALTFRLEGVTVRGPSDPKYWPRPKNYERFFTKDAPPGKAERRAYAAELLGKFASKAYRRPVDKPTVERLTVLAEGVYNAPGQNFEAGVAHAMIAVLASPRFLFREEAVEPRRPARVYPLVDEYALASRLSYFLWSSMPDDELIRLAAAGELRRNQDAQVKRMLADWRARALIQNFTGQWLQARDIDTVVVDARAILAREDKADLEMEKKRARLRELRGRQDNLTPAENDEFKQLRAEFFKRSSEPRTDLTGELRQAMRQETEQFFEYIVREDRPLAELLDSDYTFLNERLAKHYGITGISGDEMRRVSLPTNSPRGGILGQGTVQAVTSNPTRTSPVKRGLFVLDNILGAPTPPPPPDIPPLEDAAKAVAGHDPSLRELLKAHREKPLCSSCHDRMDPLGLALENFNAMGMWREQERGQPLDTSGTLITGESFASVRELKQVLVKNHLRDFYVCLTEKLLTYALGRGLEYYDTETVDQIVASLEGEKGRFSVLLAGVINSAPFQKRRNSATVTEIEPAQPAQQRAELKAKP